MKTKANSFALTAIQHPWVSDLLTHKQLLVDGLKRFDSPLNIHCLTPFQENIQQFKAVFEKYGLKHQIYFARKANKSKAFVREAKKLMIAVDTASYRELAQAIELGLDASHLVCTAAVKNRKLLELALDYHIEIAVDNRDECLLIQQIAQEKNTRARINVRIAGFYFVGQVMPSRFGFPINQVAELLAETRLGGIFDRLDYLGLHFHLNGYSIPQRAEALLQSLTLIDELKEAGFNTKSLDFGGGFLVNYLASQQQWQDFMLGLKSAALGERAALTYQNDPLGMTVLDGRIYGEPTVYPYYSGCTKADFLSEILCYKNKNGLAIHELLAGYDLQLRIEPGRSALDQAGITVAKVAFRKQDTQGATLIGLEMNRTQLRSGSADFLLDPVHIPLQENTQGKPVNAYLVGAYCLELELILKREIQFNQLPEVGDILVFINTAGYMMHFYESEAHLFELAKNVVYAPKTKTFQLDDTDAL